MLLHVSKHFVAILIAPALLTTACAHNQTQPPVSLSDDLTLTGHNWTLVFLEDIGKRASPITMDFTATDRVSGSSGCNRYSAMAIINGDRLRILDVAGTKMLCSETVMRSERTFLNFLSGRYFKYDIDGELTTLTNRAGSKARLVRFDTN